MAAAVIVMLQANDQTNVQFRDHASSSFNATSMNSLSGGFMPRPAACPQVEGIGRSSAFGMRSTSS